MTGAPDPRGPRRSIIKVERCPDGGLTHVTLDCGHVARLNQIRSYRTGSRIHCFACGPCGDSQ